MSKRNLMIGVGVVALAIGWYAFRPELFFVNKTVNEELPVAQAGSISMAKGRADDSGQGRFSRACARDERRSDGSSIGGR